MSTNSEHALDWDAQRETLSAFLDGRLPAEDEVALRSHIAACPRCSRELAELRQVVALLHTLPRAVAPRSFALPGAELAPLTPTPLAAPRARSARHPARWQLVAQWAGGLAAAAGLLIGVAGTFSSVPQPTMQPAISASGANSQQQSGHTPQNASQDTEARAATATHQAMFGTIATGTVAPVPTATAVGLPKNPMGSAATIPEAPVIGTTLLLVGAAAFAVGTGSRRRMS